MPHHHSPANHEQDTVLPSCGWSARSRACAIPSLKAELGRNARRRNADEDVIGQIEMLPGDRYASEADVATAFSARSIADTNPRTS